MDVNLILGVILVLFVLAVPEGGDLPGRALYARLVEWAPGQSPDPSVLFLKFA